LPQLAAREFLLDHAEASGIRREWLTGASLTDPGVVANVADIEDAATPGGIELRYLEEKPILDTTTVAYQQTWRGIPVWRSGVTVTLRTEPTRVASVVNTTYADIDVELPEQRPSRGLSGEGGLLTGAFGAAVTIADPAKAPSRRAKADDRRVEIVTDQVVVFCYDAAERFGGQVTPAQPPIGVADGAPHVHSIAFPFELPEPGVEDGSFRLAREIVFRVQTPPAGLVTWLAVVDIETASVLYLRPFLADVNGLVLRTDPLTQGGTAGPGSTAATLDGFRTSVTLPGLTAPAPGANQALAGAHVAVTDFEPFTVAPPTRPTGSNFDYGSRTNDFIAVNAYYHNDAFIRLVEDLGFSRATYFNGTTFPLAVDHRGRFGSTDGIEINASCSGNGTGGIANVDYELAHLGDTTNPVGIALDWRVVLHELGGHGILYDHVNSANFGFSHSAGDSFAAVLSDPDALATDRFLTFPWVAAIIARRHDRAVGAGWAWGGSQDDRGYSSEQILSTCHFRIYRSLGGDSPDVNMRRFAARVTTYLMLRGVSTLTPLTNPAAADAWVLALQAADSADWAAAGLAGGAYGKVIRWAFEKQGLYQAPGAPTPVAREGRPPAQDVYIDDGRNGEYTYQQVHWDNHNVWNRRYPDAGTLHEDPWLARTNYAYTRVRNRGTQTATTVVVKAYHTDPGAGLTWPDDWVTMTTAQISAPDIPPGGEVVVGPFEWTPTTADHECLLMIASSAGDPSNVANFGPGESIAEWRLVPHDNNIAQRNVHPVPAAAGAAGIVAVLDGRAFTVHNPFEARASFTVDIALPRVMADRGWQVRAASKGGAAFRLAAGGTRTVRLAVTPGAEISADQVVASPSRDVVVSVRGDGILLGGMTYRLDPDRAEPMPQGDPDGQDCGCGSGHACRHAARGLLRCLDLPDGEVKSVRVRSVGVDIEMSGC